MSPGADALQLAFLLHPPWRPAYAALGCLSKLQMAYFAPFLLLGLALCCAGSAAAAAGARRQARRWG